MIVEASDGICALPRSPLLHVMSWLRKRATPVSSIMIQKISSDQKSYKRSRRDATCS
jgi:hypothetical protein